MLVAFMGLPGSGKSTLIRRAAPLLGAAVLDKDAVRAAIFGPLVDYSEAQDALVMEMLFQAAGYLLQQNPNRPILLDGRVYSKLPAREAFLAAARRLGTPWRVIYVTCEDAAACQRLERDVQAGAHVAANRNTALYWKLKGEFAPLDLPHLRVDTTSGDLESCTRQVVEYLKEPALYQS